MSYLIKFTANSEEVDAIIFSICEVLKKIWIMIVGVEKKRRKSRKYITEN